MKFRKYFGDRRLRDYVVQNERYDNKCIYCGGMAKTKEHTPSKVFLQKPYPAELFITPACLKCNNSFSFAELSVAMFIDVYQSIYSNTDYSETLYKRINKFPKIFYQAYIGAKFYPKTHLAEDIRKVIAKLAIGHSVFELSSQYFGVRFDEGIQTEYSLLPFMNQGELDGYNSIEQVDVVPEIGSRIYGDLDNPYGDDMLGLSVMKGKFVPIGGDPDKDAVYKQFFIIDWVEVQEDNYRYICFHKGADTIVKIVIKEFLYATVIFHSN